MTKASLHVPVPLGPRGDQPAPMAFRRGSREPYGNRWFGTTALLGHLRHLGAEALASGLLDVAVMPIVGPLVIGHSLLMLVVTGLD
jgi:hypothetical protein